MVEVTIQWPGVKEIEQTFETTAEVNVCSDARVSEQDKTSPIYPGDGLVEFDLPLMVAEETVIVDITAYVTIAELIVTEEMRTSPRVTLAISL